MKLRPELHMIYHVCWAVKASVSLLRRWWLMSQQPLLDLPALPLVIEKRVQFTNCDYDHWKKGGQESVQLHVCNSWPFRSSHSVWRLASTVPRPDASYLWPLIKCIAAGRLGSFQIWCPQNFRIFWPPPLLVHICIKFILKNSCYDPPPPCGHNIWRIPNRWPAPMAPVARCRTFAKSP